jgi:hypothetical protein
MSKKLAFILVLLLVVPSALTACSSASVDAATSYVNAVLKGNVEQAQKYACESYQDETQSFTALYTNLSEAQLAVRNIDLKFDTGKGNNQKEVIVTGSYDIVQLNAQGEEVPDSADEYILAAATVDKRDVDQDGDDTEKIDTRILLTMKEVSGKWCVAKMEGGYFGLLKLKSEVEPAPK